jgi:hypothetical protein
MVPLKPASVLQQVIHRLRLTLIHKKMKKQFFTLAMTAIVAVAAAQTEQDDLYFSSKDRKMIIAARPKTVKTLGQRYETVAEEPKTTFDGNYTGRTLNPDYNPGIDDQNNSSYDYFDTNYAPMSINNRLYGGYGNNYQNYQNFQNTSYNYGGSYFNSYYDPFYTPYRRWWNYDPFYSYGYGGWNSYYYGAGCFSCWSFGTTFGLGSGWYMSSAFGGYSGWGFGSYYRYGGFGGFYGGYYPGSVVIINGDHRPHYSYGKRPNRSIDYNNDHHTSVRPNNVIVSGSGSRTPSNTNGRSTAPANPSYYQRGWRQDPAIHSRTPQNINPSTSGRSSNWSTPNHATWGNSDWNSGHSSRGSELGSGSRSNGFSSGSHGSGSGSHSSGSSSGGRRGRN